MLGAALLGALVVAIVALDGRPAQAGYPGAAERIDPFPPLVTIQMPGNRAAPSGSAPVADPAVGDTAVAAVLADLEDFWRAQDGAEAAAGRPGFRSPENGYVSVDSGDAGLPPTLCVTSAEDIAGNAFYCEGQDGIVYDSAALVPVLLGRYGSAALAAAFAHEFGHLVQDRLGPAGGGQPPALLAEAQADCHAGAFLAWAVAGNTARTRVPESSMLRAAAPALDFRDPVDVTRDDPAAHGLGLDRVGFLLAGYRGGLPGCRALSVADVTLGRPGLLADAGAPPRFASTADAERAGAESVAAFAAGLPGGGPPDPGALTPTAADRSAARPYGQFAAAAAVALAGARSQYGDTPAAACFVGAWTAVVFGRAEPGGLGSWAGDADEALDLIRSRSGATFADVAAYADGFNEGIASCG